MGTFVLGIGISVFGSVASNFGVNVQKFSQIKNKELSSELQRPYFKQTKWWGGLLFVILGALCDFGSLSFAPQAVVMPVGSLTLVANVFFAHFWLGEELGFTDIIGTAFIVLGAVVIAVSYGALGKAPENGVYYDADDLQELFHRWIILAYGVTVLVVLGVFLYILQKCEHLVKSGKSKGSEYKGFYAKMHPLSYAAVAGIFGSFSVTFGKAIGELLASTASDEKDGVFYAEPLFYVFLVCMVATILLQTHYLAEGLGFFDALFIVPVFQCFFIVLSILGGALYWEEMADFNAVQWAIFPIGVLVTLYGVYLMSSRDMDIEPEDKKPLDLETSSDRTKEEHPLQGIIRPRLATMHPKLAKAIMPLLLLDNPVLRDPDNDGVSNNSYRAVTNSSRQIARKSRMVSATGPFIPFFMDHETGDISRENIGLIRLPRVRIIRRHHPALTKFKNRRKTLGSESVDAESPGPGRLISETELSSADMHREMFDRSNPRANDLRLEARMHSASLPSISTSSFLSFEGLGDATIHNPDAKVADEGSKDES